MTNKPGYEMHIIDAHATRVHQPVAEIFRRRYVTDEAEFATTMIRGMALGMCKPSAPLESHQPMELMTPKEVVKRACDIAEATFAELEKRNWFVELPSYEECLAKVSSDGRKPVGFNGS